VTDRAARILETVATILVAPLLLLWFAMSGPASAGTEFEEWWDRRREANRPRRRDRRRGE
jgi:hypothetical protein